MNKTEIGKGRRNQNEEKRKADGWPGRDQRAEIRRAKAESSGLSAFSSQFSVFCSRSPFASQSSDFCVLRTRAIIFDLFHTLTSLEVSQAPGRGPHEILGIDREQWFAAWTQDPLGYALGKVDASVPLRMLARQLNPAVTEEQIQAAIASRQARFRHAMTHVEAETIDGLKRLRAAGFKLGLISNCGLDEIESWHESPLSPLLDVVVFSCKVGVRKPDPEIYRIAAQQLAVAPGECLYVGNGGTDELRGARRAGMTPVLLTFHIEFVNPARIAEVAGDADWQVRTVSDLADRLIPSADFGDTREQAPFTPK